MSTSREEQVLESIATAAAAAAGAMELAEELVAGEPRVSDGEWLVTEQSARVVFAELSGGDAEVLAIKVGAALLGLLGGDVEQTLSAMLDAAATAIGEAVSNVTIDGEIEPAPGDGVAAIETASGMAVAEVRIRLSEPLNDDDVIAGEVVDGDEYDGGDGGELTVEDVLAAAPADPAPDFVPEFAPSVAAPSGAEQLVGAMSAPAGPPRTINSAGSGSPLMHVTRLDQLAHVEMEVTVEIGRTRMTIGELLSLTPGQVIELDRADRKSVV